MAKVLPNPAGRGNAPGCCGDRLGLQPTLGCPESGPSHAATALPQPRPSRLWIGKRPFGRSRCQVLYKYSSTAAAPPDAPPPLWAAMRIRSRLARTFGLEVT